MTRAALHQRLRLARLALGLSQADLADACGYQREHLNRVECGARRSPELEVRMARALGVRTSLVEIFPVQNVVKPGGNRASGERKGTARVSNSSKP